MNGLMAKTLYIIVNYSQLSEHNNNNFSPEFIVYVDFVNFIQIDAGNICDFHNVDTKFSMNIANWIKCFWGNFKTAPDAGISIN